MFNHRARHPSPTDNARVHAPSDEEQRAPSGAASPYDVAESVPWGVYVHFPWCLSKCPYCDFLSIAADPADIPGAAYARAVVQEVAARAEQLARAGVERPSVGSVFFGGGTPSLWAAESIGAVLEALARYFALSPNAERTVECNPSSFDQRYAEELLKAGIDRVSIGVQSLHPTQLEFLGRRHDGPRAVGAIEQAMSAGFRNVSGDLIHGIYGQGPARAAAEARAVAELGVQHLSAYVLTVEPGTRFGARHRKGQLPLLEEALVADSFQAVAAELEQLGFEHYEISNFAKPGFRARHNLGYWRGAPYLGLGLGAWGTLRLPERVIRYRNTVVAERYLELEHWPLPAADNSGAGLVHQQFEQLQPEQLVLERLMLGLRIAEGVDLVNLEEELGVTVLTPTRQRRIERLQQRQQVIFDGRRLAIPRTAWLHADGIITELA